MKYSVIDIGSNSMRLTVYKAKDGAFKILFKEKRMLGLAGYVEKGRISERGIRRAYEGLLEFRRILESLDITERIYVFATASLRNIVNTEEAAARITEETGFDIDVITGEEEAVLGYTGAMRELSVSDGVFVDIGGASTEIAVFKEGGVLSSNSFHVGSLKLYKECVTGILPGKDSVRRIKKTVDTELSGLKRQPAAVGSNLICTGGTARSLLKFARYLELIPAGSNSMTVKQLGRIEKQLTGDRKKAADIILKTDPERIHTIIPGLLILQNIAAKYGAEKITVSNYGVREGYLCQRVLNR